MNEYGALMRWYWHGKAEVLRNVLAPSVTLPIANPTWAGLALNTGFWL